MPRFNELLPGRFNEGISAVLGLSEQPGVQTVAPEIMPVFEVEREKPEHAFPKKERLAAGAASTVADVANITGLQLLNPIGSELLVCVELASIAAALAATATIVGVYLVNAPVVLTTDAGAGVRRDSRWVGRQSQAQIRSGVFVPATGDIIWSIRLTAGGDSGPIPLDAVLSAGWSIILAPTAINIGLTAAFRWRERKILPEERGSL